jgi:hypothetical protein
MDFWCWTNVIWSTQSSMRWYRSVSGCFIRLSRLSLFRKFWPLSMTFNRAQNVKRLVVVVLVYIIKNLNLKLCFCLVWSALIISSVNP